MAQRLGVKRREAVPTTGKEEDIFAIAFLVLEEHVVKARVSARGFLIFGFVEVLLKEKRGDISPRKVFTQVEMDEILEIEDWEKVIFRHGDANVEVEGGVLKKCL